jgi:Dynein attachment factor N-terminus
MASSGVLDAAKLQKEMTSALRADEKRKKVDTMKKRAIHTCGSYDEFRHMVSCAELNTVRYRELRLTIASILVLYHCF